jgi:dipeptidyl aminopeptidase/acylaminoacyl peptidase
MQRDIRQTPLFKEIEEQYRRLLEPAFGSVASASSPVVSPDGRKVAFTGIIPEKLEGSPTSRVCVLNRSTGEIEQRSAGPNDDRLPAWSPDGARLAFLSDRAEKGQNLLYIAQADAIDAAVPAPAVPGTAEYLAWSPDGRSILLGVAGRGADISGGQGGGTHEAAEEELPSWMPEVESGVDESDWRRLYLYDVDSGEMRPLSREGLNVWEAAWAGPDRIVAIISQHPGEAAWYTAPLALVDVETGEERILYRSEWQLGVPVASPSGRRLAVVEAVCSDRLVVAGDPLLVDPETGETTRVETSGVDVTALTWRDDARLLFAGIRGLHSVVGEYNARTGETRELWDTQEGLGIYFPDPARVSPLREDGFVVTRDSYARYPELVEMADGQTRTIRSFEHGGVEYLRSIAGTMEEVRWKAPDGQEIQGFLVRPTGSGPFPLITVVHGGPVSAYRNRWPADHRVSLGPLLAGRGYAVFYPNPRGSVGRGQEFARAVYGDLGGAETNDTLSGIDALVERGIADPNRLGVTGGSHGGFMTSWLVTQTDRFAAAVSVAPVNDWRSFHWTSNIPYFDTSFLQDDPTRANAKYDERSPVMFAKNVRTPTLNIAGGKDRCTPPTQAVEFHNALLENGVESALVIYPEEGHGVRTMPAAIDYAARVIGWFDGHMSAGRASVQRELAATR